MNGKDREVDGPMSLARLVEMFKLGPQAVIAEINGMVVRKEEWGQTELVEGDRIELVSLVGGG